MNLPISPENMEICKAVATKAGMPDRWQEFAMAWASGLCAVKIGTNYSADLVFHDPELDPRRSGSRRDGAL